MTVTKTFTVTGNHTITVATSSSGPQSIDFEGPIKVRSTFVASNGITIKYSVATPGDSMATPMAYINIDGTGSVPKSVSIKNMNNQTGSLQIFTPSQQSGYDWYAYTAVPLQSLDTFTYIYVSVTY